jgi:hypothetical protein
MPCSPLKIDRRFDKTCLQLQDREAGHQHESRRQAELFGPEEADGIVFPKSPLTVKRLHGVMVQMFIISAVRSSNPTSVIFFHYWFSREAR